MALVWIDIIKDNLVTHSGINKIKDNIDQITTELGITPYTWTQVIEKNKDINYDDVQELKDATDYLDDNTNPTCSAQNANYNITVESSYYGTVESAKDSEIDGSADNTIDSAQNSGVYTDKHDNVDTGNFDAFNNDDNSGVNSDENTSIDSSDDSGHNVTEDNDVFSDKNSTVESDEYSNVENSQNITVNNNEDSSYDATHDNGRNASNYSSDDSGEYFDDNSIQNSAIYQINDVDFVLDSSYYKDWVYTNELKYFNNVHKALIKKYSIDGVFEKSIEDLPSHDDYVNSDINYMIYQNGLIYVSISYTWNSPISGFIDLHEIVVYNSSTMLIRHRFSFPHVPTMTIDKDYLYVGEESTIHKIRLIDHQIVDYSNYPVYLKCEHNDYIYGHYNNYLYKISKDTLIIQNESYMFLTSLLMGNDGYLYLSHNTSNMIKKINTIDLSVIDTYGKSTYHMVYQPNTTSITCDGFLYIQTNEGIEKLICNNYSIDYFSNLSDTSVGYPINVKDDILYCSTNLELVKIDTNTMTVINRVDIAHSHIVI